MRFTCFIAMVSFLSLTGCAPSIHDTVGRNDRAAVAAMLDVHPELIHARNAQCKTPLHYAVTYGATDMIDFLIARGADVNARDKTGLTPLHTAAMLDRSEEASLLLAHGANLEARDEFGDTPFHLAALFGRPDMVYQLAMVGAKQESVNNRGETPRGAARRNRDDDVIEMLDRLEAMSD